MLTNRNDAGQRHDVIIIGGGIMGLSIARELAEQRFGRIVLLERKHLAAGSTGKSGAILRQHYSHEVTVGMARESLGFYRSFEERFGIDIGFRSPGMVIVGDASARQALAENISLQQRLGVDTQLLDAAAIRALEPRATVGDDEVAAWEPEASYVRPRAAAEALGTVCRQLGVDVRVGAVVAEILHEAGAVVGVRTTQGETLAAPVVINSGGPWARQLLGDLGKDLPLSTIRPQQAFFEATPEVQQAARIYGDLVHGIYWKPEDERWTRVGHLDYTGDLDVDPDDYDEGVSNDFIADVRARISRRLPCYGQAVSWGGCGALYTVTPDAHALIGELSQCEANISGLYLVAGFSGHGFKLAPAIGRGVASLITGSDPGAFRADFFAIDRFRGKDRIKGQYQYGILG